MLQGRKTPTANQSSPKCLQNAGIYKTSVYMIYKVQLNRYNGITIEYEVSWLLELYVFATSKVMPGPIPTSDSAL